jgi:hypothetical protein
MQITEKIIDELSKRINTENSKKEHTYVPPYDIKKSIEAFLNWLNENGYKIAKPKE